MAQRVGRGIALLFHDSCTKSGWVVSSTPRPYFTPGKDPVPIVQEAGWAPGSVWTAENFAPPGFDPRTVQPVAQSLYRLSYPTHTGWDTYVRVIRTNKIHTFSLMFQVITVSSTCFEQPSVHPQEYLYMQCFGISFMRPYKQSGRWQDVLHTRNRDGLSTTQTTAACDLRRHMQCLQHG